MTLSFSQHLNGKPTYFPEKIIAALNIIKGQDLVFRREHDLLFEVIDPTEEQFRAGSCNPLFPHVPKLHTIRKDKANRWKPGMDIHMVINNRTPNRYQFVPVVKCVSTDTFVKPISGQTLSNRHKVIAYLNDETALSRKTIGLLVKVIEYAYEEGGPQ